jgi:DNA-binding NarL/FixJ family response regulator
VLDPKVVEALVARKGADEGPLTGLTGKEREVLHVMAAGSNNATIASTLFMSERAVEKHIGTVFQKLGLVDERVTNRRVMAVLAYLEAIGPRR